jgi:hypothetical protein
LKGNLSRTMPIRTKKETKKWRSLYNFKQL